MPWYLLRKCIVRYLHRVVNDQSRLAAARLAALATTSCARSTGIAKSLVLSLLSSLSLITVSPGEMGWIMLLSGGDCAKSARLFALIIMPMSCAILTNAVKLYSRLVALSLAKPKSSSANENNLAVLGSATSRINMLSTLSAQLGTTSRLVELVSSSIQVSI